MAHPPEEWPSRSFGYGQVNVVTWGAINTMAISTISSPTTPSMRTPVGSVTFGKIVSALDPRNIAFQT